ncbi:hypothetical protein RCH12_002166 [Cryobacterium sp. MP_3.1]|uniref:Uncharacterized protein n=1 Tax=Cryobacterium zongtaii TaxID=1259217 RepID=A0A2S3Z7B2_9MICO|nr:MULTISPECIES: hypothetical protein [Cryobacterium]MEC5184696.1 hypothetical protein [Cryobacterium sp. MP_3.1]POH61455.1 hypothetical protein C3B59_12495 [Cryobacterium zongtaii]
MESPEVHSSSARPHSTRASAAAPGERRTSNAEWLQVLDDLETSLGSGARDAVLSAQGGQLVTGVQWRAPEHIGQLPRELEERARMLLTGQLELIREIEDARRSAGAHLAAVRTILSTHSSDQPVYLDIAG